MSSSQGRPSSWTRGQETPHERPRAVASLAVPAPTAPGTGKAVSTEQMRKQNHMAGLFSVSSCGIFTCPKIHHFNMQSSVV